MDTPRINKEARKHLDGKVNTIKGLLLDIETSQSLFAVDWFYDKIMMNKNHQEESQLKKQINTTTDLAIKNKLKERINKVSQKNVPKPILIGDVVHIKFGVGVGHELKEHHFGIVLARKGLMFLIAPLTSVPQDYGDLNYSFNNLNLSKKTNISYVSFCHIKYIHQRRIENITTANNKVRNVRTGSEAVNNILDNYFKIVKNS